MPSTLDYALMAGASYIDTRDPINRFPAPQNWVSFKHESGASGFEAISFVKGTDIVISYAGTYEKDITGDIFADIGLATGVGSAQLLQAAEYYLQVKAENSTATSITFTGHSLGGGLAALMGVFFGQQAVTFDQAPFANSAELNVLTPDVAANLKADLLASGHTEDELLGLTNFLQLRATNGGIPNSNLVTNINVQGEFLSGVPWNIPDRIGTTLFDINNSASGVSGDDLHAQSLLTAFLQSNETAVAGKTLNEVTGELTDLLKMIFDNNLFANETDTNQRNFLDHLVRHQVGVQGSFAADAMVTRFTDDLWKLAQDGGLTMTDNIPGGIFSSPPNDVSKTLTAFAMQKYYDEQLAAGATPTELFTDLTTAGLGSNGIHFDTETVVGVGNAITGAKGYNLYFQNYLDSSAFSNAERQLIQPLLPTLRDWYVQAGANGMNVADVHNRGAFMLGGNGADNLTGGTQADLLVGNAGADTLDGKGGNDILFGGAGFDTYIYTTGDGTDQIEDASGQNAILFDQQLLQGGIRQASGGAYTSLDGRFTYVQSGGDLLVNGSLILNENFQNGQFGIRLMELPDYAPVTRAEFQKIDRYMQVGNDPDGNPIYEPVYVPFFTDSANDTRDGMPQLGGLTPPLGDDHNLIHALGGNDMVISGAGDDQLYGEDGDDVLAGFGGNDQLYGGIGNDTINGDDSLVAVSGNDYLDGGDGDDILQGSAGSDVVLGGSGNDSLNGDDLQALQLGIYGNDFLDGGDGADELHGVGGSDVLFGGAGNDFLLGDAAVSQGGTSEAGGGDSLDGGSGDDYLDGQFGDDVLLGGLDDDGVNGGDGSDVLYGGEGNDTLSGDLRLGRVDGLYATAEYRGAGGTDILDGGTGIDFLYGGEGDDVLNGGDGDDTLYGDYNPNLFPVFAYVDVAGANDMLNGTAIVWGNDVLDGGEGSDTLRGGDGHDVLRGGAGDDGLFGGDGDDELDGGDGADTLDGGPGVDVVRAGAGDDRLIAGVDDDTLYGEDGNDTLISGNESRNTGNSVLVGGSGNDAYVIDSAADTVVEEADAGVDSVRSFVSYTLPDHVENVSLSRSGLTATGNALANELRGATNSTLDGREGDDQLVNGRWYRFGYGYDHDTVLENDPSSAPYFPGGVADAVQFTAEVTPDQVQWQRQGNDLVVSLDGTTDTLTIPSFYTLAFNQGSYFFSSNIFLPGSTVTGGGNPYYVTPSQVERFEFADGTVWGVEAFDATMIGAHNANTYAFGLGDGQDTILDFDFTGEQPTDMLQMKTGVAPSDVILRRVGDDLQLGFEGTTDQLTVQSHFASVFVRFLNFSGQFFNTYQIEQIQFTDGTVWDAAAIANQLTDLVGTAAADLLRGNARANTIQGLGGNDWLESFGNDDLLDGGAGNDTLLGGIGDDTYRFDLGDGVDTIDDVALVGEGNRIQFGAGIGQDNLTFTRDEAARTLTIQVGSSGTDQLRLLNFDPTGANGSLVVETLTFVDGGSINLVDLFPPIINHAPTLATPLADQTVPEDAPFSLVVPSNTFADEDAGDVLTLSASLADCTALPAWLSFDAATATFTGTPDDAQVGMLDLKVTATDHENLNVSDIFMLTVTNVNETPTGAAPLANQTAVEDTAFTFIVPGSTFADVDPGDVLTYSTALADGTSLPSWLSFDPSTRTFSGTPLNSNVGTLALTVTATDQGSLSVSTGFTLAVQNVNDAPLVVNPVADQTAAEDSAFALTVPSTTFADEDVIHGDMLTYSATLADGSPLPTWLSFNPTTRTLSGTPGAGDAGSLQIAVIATDTGNLSATDLFTLAISGPLPQTVIGTAGNDVLTGGRGDDTLTGLAGNDTLTGGQGHDLLDGGTGTDTMQGGTGNDTYIVDVSGDVVTELANEGTDTVQSSVTYTLSANVENLTLTGTANLNGTGNALDNILTGNSGANVLTGGAGNDTYIVGAGDSVAESLNSGTDTVQSAVTWTLGSNVENLTLTGTANINGTGSSANNVLIGNSGNNQLDSGSGNDTADGGAGNDTLLGGSGDDTLMGGVGDDTLNAGSGNDVLNGGDGADTLDGGSGDDQLFGGAGNDVLTGGSGADQFTGGTGNDALTGGSGNDLYNFIRGDGQDTILDSDPFPGNQDRAGFDVTINPLDLVISRQANDLRLAIHGSSDQITVQNWYLGTTNQIETIQAGNGQTLLSTQVNQLIQAMAGFTAQTGLTWDQAIDQQPQDVQTVLAASWQ